MAILRMLLQLGDPILEELVDVLAPHIKANAVPVNEAISYNRAREIPVLIALGASVDAQDPEGNTALHIAAANGYIDGVKALLNANASADIANHAGIFPLELAINFESIPQLVEASSAATQDSVIQNIIAKKKWIRFEALLVPLSTDKAFAQRILDQIKDLKEPTLDKNLLVRKTIARGASLLKPKIVPSPAVIAVAEKTKPIPMRAKPAKSKKKVRKQAYSADEGPASESSSSSSEASERSNSPVLQVKQIEQSELREFAIVGDPLKCLRKAIKAKNWASMEEYAVQAGSRETMPILIDGYKSWHFWSTLETEFETATAFEQSALGFFKSKQQTASNPFQKKALDEVIQNLERRGSPP